MAKELLGLQHHPGVEAMPAQVAISGALVAGVPGVLLGTLEAFPRRVVLLPGILGDRAGIFPALPRKQSPKVSVNLEWERDKEEGRGKEGMCISVFQQIVLCSIHVPGTMIGAGGRKRGCPQQTQVSDK